MDIYFKHELCLPNRFADDLVHSILFRVGATSLETVERDRKIVEKKARVEVADAEGNITAKDAGILLEDINSV